MSVSLFHRAGMPAEGRVAMTGTWVEILTLTAIPAKIIFDNQSTVDIQIGIDESTVWHTFPAGEALILDMRDAQGRASNFGFSKGTTFYGNGSNVGTNYFSISIVPAIG